jgi:hypothetical protein
MRTPTISNYIGYFLAVLLIGIVTWIIKTQVNEYYLQNDPMLITLKEIIRPIKYQGKSIADGLKLYKGRKSYTINKENTFMCLYDEKGEYYPLNLLLYVLLHERSHSLNLKDVGHTPEFHRIFQELLDEAEGLGIYNSKIPIDDNYCLYAGDDDE